jgi:hypothetical protein
MPLPLAVPPPDPAIELFVASQGMSQGISQTDGIQVRPRLTLRLGNAQLGAQWRNVSSPVNDGVAMLFARYGRSVGKVQLEGTATYRIRTGLKPGLKAGAWEFTGNLRRKLPGGDVRLEVQYSPDEFGRGTSLYVEAGPAIDLAPATRLSANVGRRERRTAPDYMSFNLGVTTTVRSRLSFDARLFDTNRGGLGPPFRACLVLSARVTL